MMRSRVATAPLAGFLLTFLLPLLSLPAHGQNGAASGQPVIGRILDPDETRMVARRETCRCESLGNGAAEIVLLTLGTEREVEGELHFHPMASLAFDPSLSPDEPGEWVALWVYGPSAAGWQRHLRALLPLPVGAPRASTSVLEQLEKRLESIQENSSAAEPMVPDPVVHLANLESFPRSQGFWNGLRRVLGWADVLNPAQLLYRSYLVRRKDRSERDFQRSFLALQWLQDVGFSGSEEAAWVDILSDLRFHLLRNRSFYGRWLEHADGHELVYNYESGVRQELGKSSAWMQSAANEHFLRYQPIYRYSANGSPIPLGGVLYFDAELGAQADPGWWRVANPFDLPYNPHTHPEVQRLAREHPDELIPLAIYTYHTSLAVRPIIAVDFFAPNNPRDRERSQQTMVLLKQWLTITTSPLALERLPYRVVAWAANKKGFTRLVDKSSRQGNEELRWALEANLYFDPALRRHLLHQADQRALNPLVKAGEVEEWLAHIQYESLRAQQARPLCRQVEAVRQRLAEKLGVPASLTPEARREELSRRLYVWQQETHLADFVSQPLGDFGSLATLQEPLERLRDADSPDPAKLEALLARLYRKLHRQQLSLPPGRVVEELTASLALTREVWQKTLPEGQAFERHRADVERKAEEQLQKELAEREKKRLELFRGFLENSHKQLERAARAGCHDDRAVSGELEAHLTILQDVLETAPADQELRAELNRHSPHLRGDLTRLEATLAQCPDDTRDTWVAESRQSCRELAQLLSRRLDASAAAAETGGVD